MKQRGRFTGEWTHHYSVNTGGDHQRQSPRVFTVLPTAPHDRRAARIKGHCVDNAVSLDSQLRYAWQPEDVLGNVQMKHRLNLTRQIGKMATRIDRPFYPQVMPYTGFII